MAANFQIIIIRHGEKPAGNTDPNLSAAGRTRADMLAKKLPPLYPDIAVLYATAHSKDSDRSVETITPLSKALKLKIHDNFGDNDHAALATHVLAHRQVHAGKTVLICWHHEKIPDLAHDLGAAKAPQNWPDAVFDQIWQLDFPASGPPSFAIKPEPAIN